MRAYRQILEPFRGVRVYIIGKRDDGEDGRVGLASDTPDYALVARRVREVLPDLPSVHVHVPNITVPLTCSFETAPGTSFNLCGGHVTVHHGVVGGAQVIPKGHCGYIAPADCPVVLVHYEDLLVMLHGALFELIDDAYIQCRQEGKEHGGVLVQTLLHIAREFGPGALRRTHVYSFLSISPKGYCFPTKDHQYAKENARRNLFLSHMYRGSVGDDCINLYALIGGMATDWNVPPWNVRCDDTYTDTTPWLHSHRRDRGGKRNSVIVHFEG